MEDDVNKWKKEIRDIIANNIFQIYECYSSKNQLKLGYLLTGTIYHSWANTNYNIIHQKYIIINYENKILKIKFIYCGGHPAERRMKFIVNNDMKINIFDNKYHDNI